ncbi:hypothetical protein FNF27_03103 [Cafeteria roenbergensis]|uniref:CBM20 domain-containing protein n=1 Tax=Cafeteria roenbergensis TaxID=33653 RepID=A0A5A8EBU6_CAFRO|nr:hypothetical protein FNF31_01061 [Cafeteria roenbergensis]KAA0175403.1 hypothetical protein FNF27_03103 [Cafeteria roenbergensis]|mmetsp:Transcript_25871/g.97435  ORF Transcript_25871/g.97435 Transcript_25871/m.97435 type:complete len:2091 (+) Transcript_25871:93-6365(+)
MAAPRATGNQGFCHLTLIVKMPSPRLEGVAVLGNLPALGSWETPVPMVAIEGGARWKLPEPVAVPRGASIRYRYAFTQGGRLVEYEPIEADRRLVATNRGLIGEDVFGDAEDDDEAGDVATHAMDGGDTLQPPSGSAFAGPRDEAAAADAGGPPRPASDAAPVDGDHGGRDAPSMASRAARRAMSAGLTVAPLSCGSPVPDVEAEAKLVKPAASDAPAPSLQSDSDSHSQTHSLGHIRVPPASNPMRAIQAAARAKPAASGRPSPRGSPSTASVAVPAAKEGVITGSMVYHEVIPAVLGSLMRRRRMVCVTLSLPVILRKLPSPPGGPPRWTAVFDPDDFLARGASRSVADTVEVLWVGFVTRECMDRVTASEAPRRSSVASTDSDRRLAGVAPGSPPALGLSARPSPASADAGRPSSTSGPWTAVDQAVEAHLAGPEGKAVTIDATPDASGLNLGLVDSLDHEPQVDDLVVPLAAEDRKAIREALEGISCVPIFLEDMAHMESARRAASAAAAAARAGAHKAGQDSGASVTSSAARAAAAPVASHTASSAPAGASSDAQGRGGPNAGAGAGDEFVGGGAAGAAGESGEGAARPGRPPPIRPTEGPAPGATSHAGTPGAAHDGDDEVALVAGIDTPADKAGAYQLPSGTLGPEPVRSPTAADHADRPSSGAFGGVAGSSGEGGWAPDLAGAAGSAAPRAHSRHGTVDSQASNRTAPAASGPQARCSTPEAGATVPDKPASASEGGSPPAAAAAASAHRRGSSVVAPTDCEPSPASMAHALRLMRRFAAYLSMVIGPNLHNVQEVGDLPSLMSFGASFLSEAAAGAASGGSDGAQPPVKRARSPGGPPVPPSQPGPRAAAAASAAPLFGNSPATGRTAGLPRVGPEVVSDSPATAATRRAGFGRLHVDAVLAVAQRGWKAYRRINEGFARVIMEVYKEGDVVWTHDYWLCLLPAYLSHLCNPSPSLIFFMHAPFPTSEIFRTLGNREELVRGMLAADVVGFHTFNHARHFLQVCKRVLGIPFSSREGGRIGLDIGGRDVSVTISHVGVEPEELDKLMASEEAAAYARDLRRRHPDRVIIAGMDSAGRLQGIALKLLAFERLLEQNQQLAHAVVLVQCVETRPIAMHSDSAMNKRELGQLVRRINERFGPVVDLIEAVSFGPSFRVGLFHSADVLFQTPVREGLSLMPLEYIFVRTRWQLRRSAALYGTADGDGPDGSGTAPASPTSPSSRSAKGRDDAAAGSGGADGDLDASSFVLEPAAAANFPGGVTAQGGRAPGAGVARSLREPPKRGHTRRSSDPSSLSRDGGAAVAHVSTAEARETLLSSTRHRHDAVLPPGSPVNLLGEMPAHYATIAAPRDSGSQGGAASGSVDALLGRDGRTPPGQPSAQLPGSQAGSRRAAVAAPARPAGVSGLLDAAVPEEDDDDDEDATAQERRERTRGTPGMPPAPGFWSPASPSMGPSSDGSPRPRDASGSPVLGASRPARAGASVAGQGIASASSRRASDAAGRPGHAIGRTTALGVGNARRRGSPRLAPARRSPLAGPAQPASAAEGGAPSLRHSASLPFLPRVRSFAHVMVPNIPDVEALTAPLPPPDRGGCVVLSEFSTASHILNSTLRVNPFHVDDTAKTLAKAIGMEDSERSHRQWRDYHYAKRNPSAHWSRRVLTELLTVEAEAATGSGTFTELEPSVSTRNAFSVPAQLGRRGAGASCSHLVTDAVAESFSAAGRRVLFVDYGGTLIAREGSGMYVKHEFLGQSHSARTLPHDVLRDLARLAADPASTVVVLVGLNISNGDAAALASIPNLTIALENSAVVSWGARDKMRLSGLVKGSPVGAEGIAVNVNTAIFAGREWVRLPESAQFLEGALSAEWREAVAVARARMDEYRWRVNGSTVRETGAMLSWDYSNADPEWGKQQAGRLVDDLRAMLTSPNVSVGRRRVMVEVSPAGVTKGTLAERILASLTSTEAASTFALAVGDDSSDEDMFKAVHSFVVRAAALSVPGPLDADADGDSVVGPTPDTGSSSPAPNTSSTPETDPADPMHAASAAAAGSAAAPAQGVRVYSVCVGRKHSSARYFLGNVKEVRSLIAELAATF